MTISATLKKYIEALPEGKSFSSTELRAFASTANIRQFLSRQVKAGSITRLGRGVFAKPKQSALAGSILPNAAEIAASLSQSTGEVITVQGAEAARMLQLTTQVPLQPIFYSSGNSRTLKFHNTKIHLKHVNPSRLIATGTIPGLVICALIFVGRKNVTFKTIEKIKTVIPPEEFKTTLKLTEKMPAWMADIFYHYQKENLSKEI